MHVLTRLLTIAALTALGTGMSAARADVPIERGSLRGLRDLGPAPASVRAQIAIVLNYRHEAELDQLVSAQADPQSSLYHRFLTASQFRGYFSPQPADYEHVVKALQRAGFSVEHAVSNYTVIDASAPAPVAAAYFATDIHRVHSPSLGLTYVNVREGSVPLDIAGLALGVFGLDAAHELHTGPESATRATAQVRRLNVSPNGYPLFGPDGGYGPQIFVDAYDLPAKNGMTGLGRSSGLVMSGDFLESDLATYLSYFGVSRTGPPSTRVAVDGGAPQFPGGAASEATLDVETIVSLAPGTALYVYELPTLQNRPVLDAYNRVVSDDLVDTLNSSFGDCEQLMHGQFSRAVDAIIEQAAAEGITFHSATGDSGIYQADCKGMSIGQPSDSPHGVAVGGTTLTVSSATGQVASEIGWGEPGSGATGGGVSVIFKTPSFQTNVPNVIASGRNVPDVAFDGDSTTGTSIYFNGTWAGPDGGTSLSSPIFGAALTEIDQIQNSRAGNFDVTLYATWLENGYGPKSKPYIRDITEGSIPPYFARPGYDQMTGIGALQVNRFARLLPQQHR
jgi:subtilase family serine protease